MKEVTLTKKKMGQELKKRKQNLEFDLQFSRLSLEKIQEKMDKLAKKKHIMFVYSDSLHQWKLFIMAAKAKDNYITSLIEEAEDINVRARTAKQMQLEIVDEIIGVYDEELKHMNKHYIQSRDRYVRERFDYLVSLEKRVQDKVDTISAIQHDFEKKAYRELNSLLTDAMVQHDKLKQWDGFRKFEIQIGAETEILKLWSQYQTIIQNYRKSTSTLRTEFVSLAHKDSVTRGLFDKAQKVLIKNKVNYKYYLEISDCQELRTLLNYYSQERNLYCSYYQKLKERIKFFHEFDDGKLCKLSIVSNAANEQLKIYLEKLNVLLKYMHLCRRFFTEEEKLLPVGEENKEFFPKEELYEHFEIMWKLYYRRAQTTIENEFLLQNYLKEREEIRKLKTITEMIIYNYDIGYPEVQEENKAAMHNLN